jgi:outer membrane protein TolC
MSKKNRPHRRIDNIDDAQKAYGALKVPSPVEPATPPPQNTPRQALPLSLADIRSEALRAHADVAHSIADLEAWRSEIEATIAFLKAQSR